jgi:hypothetical protein
MDLKEAHAAKVQALECANMVLEQNLQLKATEFNDLQAKHESLLLSSSQSETAQQRQLHQMGQLNVSFMDLGQENRRLKDELAQLQLDREEQLEKFKESEEKLKAQIAQAEQATEKTRATVNQRDVQIKRLLTENARYLRDAEEHQASLKSIQAEFDKQVEDLELRDAEIERLQAENDEYKVFFNYELEKKEKEEEEK